MPATSPPTFAIQCACGVWARGERQPKARILDCSGCGQRVFVFPDSPSMFGSAPASGSVAINRSRRCVWMAPVAAAILALALVGIIITAIVRGYRSPSTHPAIEITESRAGGVFNERLAAARAALEEGSYRLAREELNAAAVLISRFPRAIDPEQVRLLSRWQRQIALLADLSTQSVGDIVRQSVGRVDREWEAIFRERYAGKAIVLDTRVFRDAVGHYHVDYRLEASGAIGAWDFDQFKLFEHLPLQQPQRLLFGFRLQAIRRPTRDRWTVVPDPESGVLFTDPLVLTGLSLPMDAELDEVLRRQSKWEAGQ